MDGAVYSAVIGSAVLHALWNALLKRQRDPEVAASGMFLVCAVCGLVVSVASPGTAFPTPASLAWAVGAGLLETGYVVGLSRALARAALGPVYTISRGGALLIVWPISVLVLGEALTPAAAAGSALVALGLAATGFASRPRGSQPAGGGLPWAVLAAGCIAGFHLCYKLALGAGGAFAPVFAVSLGIAGPLSPLGLRRGMRGRPFAELGRRPLAIGGAGILATASFLLYLYALETGGAGSVLTLRNTSILFAQGLSFALGERPTRAGVVGALLVTAGAILLGL